MCDPLHFSKLSLWHLPFITYLPASSRPDQLPLLAPLGQPRGTRKPQESAAANTTHSPSNPPTVSIAPSPFSSPPLSGDSIKLINS